MKQVKTFIRATIDDDNDEEVNEFLRTYNVKSIKTNAIQGFTYTSYKDYAKTVDSTFKPSIITTVIYEVEKWMMEKIEEHNQIPPYKISEEDLVTTKCLRQLETLPKPDYKLWAHQTNYTITMLTNSQTWELKKPLTKWAAN